MNPKELLRHSRLSLTGWVFTCAFLALIALCAVLHFTNKPKPETVCWEPAVIVIVADHIERDGIFLSEKADTVFVLICPETQFRLLSEILDTADSLRRAK